jgi:hypothetical protein
VADRRDTVSVSSGRGGGSGPHNYKIFIYNSLLAKCQKRRVDLNLLSKISRKGNCFYGLRNATFSQLINISAYISGQSNEILCL